MADANGLNPGDPGYDASSEMDPSGAQALYSQYPSSQTQPGGAVYNDPSSSTDLYAAAAQGGQFAAQQANLMNQAQASGQPYAVPAAMGASAQQATQIANQPYDYSSPGAQYNAVAAWLQSGGWGNEDPNYWVTRINQTGGFTPNNLGYWQARIGAGPGAEQPGGQYYEGAAPSPTSGSGLTTLSQNSLFADPAFTSQFRDAVLNRLQQLQQPTDPNSPAIAAPISAYNQAADRNLQQTRDALAEQAYANGTLQDGSYQTATQRALEDEALGKSAFAGQVMNTAEQQRQSGLNQLLGLGAGASNSAAALALQQELAGGQLGYNYAALQAQLNQQAMLAALGAYGG